MRMISLIILTLFASHVLPAAEVTVDLSAVTLPPGVVRAEEQMNARLEAAAQAYRQAVEQAKALAVRDLERERSRQRDALVAMAIQSKIDGVNQLAGPVDVLGKPITGPPDLSVLIGAWHVTNGRWRATWTFREGGILDQNGMPGTYFYDEVNRRIVVKADNNSNFIHLPLDDKELKGIGENGLALTITKR